MNQYAEKISGLLTTATIHWLVSQQWRHRLITRVWRYQGLIRIRKSKKDTQHNGQKKKDKRTNNDLQNTTQ